MYLGTMFVLSALFALMLLQLPESGTELTREHFVPLACALVTESHGLSGAEEDLLCRYLAQSFWVPDTRLRKQHQTPPKTP